MRRPLSFSLIVLHGSTLLGATFHVKPDGNDALNGLSMATAWATLQHAADLAVAGDSVLVTAGSYAGFAAMEHSGTANAPIVFSGLGAQVNITTPCAYNDQDGINVENVSWVVVEGFTVDGMPRTGIRTALSDHITLRHNSCDHNGRWGILTGFADQVIIEHNTCSGSVEEHGIYFSNSADDPVIRYNHCFDNRANGIHMNGDESMGGDGVISNAQVYGNVIHGNGVGGGSGINCDGVANSVFHDNLLYDNHASGISLYRIDAGGPSVDNKVYNNTIVQATDARWCINITEGCTGNQLLNNILVNQHAWRGSIAIAEDALMGFSSDHNIFTARLSPDGDATILDLAGWQALGFDLHAQEAAALNLLFADAVGYDFHAASATAQQVDAGSTAVQGFVTADIEGTPRPLGAGFDAGCHEFDGATRTPGARLPSPMNMFVRDGMLRIEGVATGAVLHWMDHIGRALLPPEVVTLPYDGPVPSVPLAIAVLREKSGHLLGTRSFVWP
ncbi:MAG: right-handed parallel beta-helix repeat-containing protein [Flavobacteriales bacterium]|nr:right-handed parallel beta-helix repeat-containing protein [Flavobacteriales bacterium]